MTNQTTKLYAYLREHEKIKNHCMLLILETGKP